jgi:hypothetical protein
MHSVTAQNPGKLTGDWMRITATYGNGSELPYNHPARVFQRYVFYNNKALVVMGNSTTPMDYTLTANQLKLGPVQTFVVEASAGKEMKLLDAKNSVRYYFIPTDSFTVSGMMDYPFTVTGPDTVYTSTPGIEPVYTEGSMSLMKYIRQGFASVKGTLEFTVVVRKDGTVGDVEITLSTNEKLNKQLIKILKKTSGKWIPGSIGGKPVHVKAPLNITMT